MRAGEQPEPSTRYCIVCGLCSLRGSISVAKRRTKQIANGPQAALVQVPHADFGKCELGLRFHVSELRRREVHLLADLLLALLFEIKTAKDLAIDGGHPVQDLAD